MDEISKSKLKSETKILTKKYNQFGRVNKKFQDWLEKRGYELNDLGTGKRSYTFSGDVGIKNKANDKTAYFGIGIYNIGKKARKSGMSVSVYRAYIKKVVN